MEKCSTYSPKTHRLEIPVHCFILQIVIPVFLMRLRSTHPFNEVLELCSRSKKKSFMSTYVKWMVQMGAQSMSCEVMPQGWCKLVFAHMQTFTRNNNFKRLLQQSYQKLPDDNIMLDGRIKTHDSGVAGVKFL